MNKCLFGLSGAFLVAVLLASVLTGRTEGTLPAFLGEKTGPRIFKAASEVFDSLSEDQRKIALHEYSSEERFNWHFIPRDRKGIPLKDLNESQRQKVKGLLSASLSETGARKAQEVMSLEDILREMEGPERKFPRDPFLYHVSFFAKPSKEGRWGWRLEGHHLSFNFTLKGEEVLSSTPAFYGANPAIVREGSKKGLRVLGPLEDVARDLVTSLDADQSKACKGEEGGAVPEEVPGTEKPRYSGPYPAGVGAEKLTAAQKKVLQKLIHEYTQNLPQELAEAYDKENGENLQDVHFAWRGGVKPYEPHSYLVHGPAFVINYTNTQNNAAHVHSCLRRLKGEFGLEGN